jgi:RNA polymerase sigma-70 factor (sigma-E family)
MTTGREPEQAGNDGNQATTASGGQRWRGKMAKGSVLSLFSSACQGLEEPAAPAERPRLHFEEFFERHHASLGRLAYLLTGNVAAAEDLTGDVFLAVWRQWSTICVVEAPIAYVRRMMVNTAASRNRSNTRERRRLLLLHAGEGQTVRDPDAGVSVDVRAALLKLPVRRRACVVLRHAFDLSEAETAAVLGVTVGTVKSQTSKGMAQLQKLLATPAQERWQA